MNGKGEKRGKGDSGKNGSRGMGATCLLVRRRRKKYGKLRATQKKRGDTFVQGKRISKQKKRGEEKIKNTTGFSEKIDGVMAKRYFRISIRKTERGTGNTPKDSEPKNESQKIQERGRKESLLGTRTSGRR